jgi:hypothetical protein
MAKSVLAAVLDAALSYIDTNMTAMSVCSTQPTTRTEAVTTYKLATVTISSADGTLANGDTSGRKLTFGAKTGLTIDANGTAQHVAITSGTELLLVTTCTSQALNTGGTVDVPSWKYEINSPT